MAEFDKSGFAAIDSFFGGSVEPSKTARTTDQPNVEARLEGKRLGLGATPKRTDVGNAEIDKRILQVGKKRQREEENDDEDSRVSEADEEEDGGRTAIAESSSTPKVSTAILVKKKGVDKMDKKKKKGKKERALEKGGTLGENEPSAAPGLDMSAVNTGEEVGGKGDSVVQKKKKKRRKIRSKQKNIYKDSREKKPDHLVPGSKDFRGRPLTAETRAKLNLPPTQSSHAKQSQSSDVWRSSWDTGVMESSIDAMPLAAEVSEEIPQKTAPKIKKEKKNRKKKSKYKNFR